ncbi:S-layer homology domain-containing protein [Patescibacteria group bacterium]|nr:S-layer homology domain-containing protein [Patescibacteria group bacterium]
MEKARLYEGLTRFELAKMMSAFIKNVAKVEAVDNAMCDITKYSDYASFDDEMKMYIKMACDYGIMGWKNDKSGIIDAFRPNDSVTREEFAAVLSRYLFGSKYDGQDMKAHLEALKDAEIMNQIDNPYVVEVRGYVLLMLQRVAEEEASADEAMPETEEDTTA